MTLSMLPTQAIASSFSIATPILAATPGTKSPSLIPALKAGLLVS